MAYAYEQDNQQDQIAQDNQQAVGAQGSSVVSQDQGQGQPNQQGQQNQLSSAPSQIGSTPQSNMSQGQPTRKQTPSGGSGFANISKYLEQNQPQAMKLGERVAGSIEDKANQARQGIQQGAESFQNQVNQNMVNYNEDLAGRAAQDAHQFSQNQDDVNAFKDMYSGQYKGPTNFQQQENYGDILNQVTGAKNQANLAGTAEGRKQLVTELQQSRRPSQGIATLNNLLLQNSPDAINRINESTQSAFNLDDYFNETLGEANRLAQEAAATSAATGQQTQQQFLGQGGVYDQFVGGLDQRVNDARSNADQTTQNILSQLASGQITPEQASYLGLDESQLANANEQLSRLNYLNDFFGEKNYLDDQYRNIDLSPYASQSATPEAAINRQNVATQDDYLKLQALSNLLGVDNNVLTENDLATASDDLVDFDLNNFLSDYGQTLNSREDALNRYNMLAKEWDNLSGYKPIDRARIGVKANNLDEYLKQRGFSVTDPSLKKIKPPQGAPPSMGM